jgi:hypothetical protein
MNVKELIEKLEGFDKDEIVHVSDDDVIMEVRRVDKSLHGNTLVIWPYQ